MSNVEKKIVKWLQKNCWWLMLIVISFLAILIRYDVINFVSGDMSGFLIPWFDKIRKMGMYNALRQQVGDYNIPYQLLIILMAKFKVDPILGYKIISCCFDFVLAISTAILATTLVKIHKKAALFTSVYTVVLFLPTVFANSALWGQCDSIYVSFIVLALVFLFKDKYGYSFIFLGIAFAFKLQTAFILPFYIYVYFAKKQFSILYFLISLVTFYLPCLPAILAGRSWLAPFNIYTQQSGEYPFISLNMPNIWALLGNTGHISDELYGYKYFNVMQPMALIFTIALLGVGLFFILNKSVNFNNAITYIKFAVWTVWTCVMFLPAMHDRYGYLVDILLIVATFLDSRLFAITVIEILVSTLTYGIYLFQIKIQLWLLVLMYVGAYLMMTYYVFIKTNVSDKMTNSIHA